MTSFTFDIFSPKNGCVSFDGARTDYIRFGSGKKNLVIIPGLGDGLKTVKGAALFSAVRYKKLSREYTVYIFSRKSPLPKNYSTRDAANDLAEAMDILGIRFADVVGISQGGAIAQYLAVDHPEKVRALVLAATYSRPNKTLLSALKRWAGYAEKGDYESLFIDSAECTYTEKYLKPVRKFYPVLTKFGKPKSFRRFLILARATALHNAFDELEKINCPTLVIGGELDKIVTPKASYDMAEKIKRSELLMFKDYGHGLYEEADDFWGEVLGFFRKAF